MQAHSEPATRNRPDADALEYRKLLKETFPTTGKTRAVQNAALLEMGVSTFWKYVKEGRIKRPMRFGARISVWDAEYIRHLAENGIPEAKTGGGEE